MTEPVYSAAKMLTAYYERNAQSLAGNDVSCPKIATFKFGHDDTLIDESTTIPTLLPIPPSFDLLEGEFFTGTAEVSTSGGRVIVKCHLPAGSLAVPHKYSITTLHDTDGTMLAVMHGLPDWITPTDEHITYGYLDFPHLSDDPPTAI